MRLLRPRSIVSLIVVGFAVVLTPFVIAVVTAVIQVDRFAADGRLTVLNVGSATEDSRVLFEQAQEMRRALEQFAVTQEREFFGIYRDRREVFRAALDRLIGYDLPGIDTAGLRAIAADEAALFLQVDSDRRTIPGSDWSTVLESQASIARRSRTVLNEVDLLVQERANRMTDSAESLQRTLLVLAAAAAPATVVLVVLFTVLITRPMRQLGLAIRSLGARTLDQPIVVRGPRDVESLAGELEWLRRRIRALEQQKATFLQHISHELKTPLATIREGSELLVESLGDIDHEEAEIARLLQQNGLHLQRLIEDLLRFAKTQDLAIDLEFEADVDLALVIEEAIAALAIVIDSRDLGIRPLLEPVAARCDGSKMRTVIDNLLTNAIKFTPERGQIEIVLSRRGDEAHIDIRDSGPGVDPEDRARIFEPFRQGRAEYQSSVKGTGLGLSIAKEYVEAHGGSIELIDSEQGAHFRVVLPIAGPVPASGG